MLEKLENLVADVFSEEGKETVASIDWGIFPGDSGMSDTVCLAGVSSVSLTPI